MSNDTQQATTVTAVILAGGQGRRMGGEDKGLIQLNRRPIISYILNRLRPQVDRILINANRNITDYQALHPEVISDELTGYQGPLAGMASAMQHTDSEWLLTLPGDSPLLPANMVALMLARAEEENADIVVAHDGERLQPVHALIRTSLLDSLLAFLANNDRKIDLWYAQHRMTTADFSDIKHSFRNINTPEQKQAIEKALATPPLVGICAYSGSGKTTLLSQLIPLLKDKGLKLTVIKHGHHTLELDKPGKDSYKFREAGADQVILAASTRMAVMQECQQREEPALRDTLKMVSADCADLILAEGFKHETYPKLEVHRPALGKPLLFPQDENIIAIITDNKLDSDTTSRKIPQLDLNAPEDVVDFILTEILQKHWDSSYQERHRIRSEFSCADDIDPSSISYKEAQERLLAATTPLHAYRKLAIRETLGRVLAEDLISPMNVPAYTNSAMDGYALSGKELPQDTVTEFNIIGTAFAGKPFAGNCSAGQCVRIMTGAVMPTGTDTVVMQEQTELSGDTCVRIGSGHRHGQNVRQAGEDIQSGQTVLSIGRRLKAADLGLMASLGIAEAKVFRPPRVAFFSTGDELRSIGEPLDHGCIYDSNRYTLYSLLTQLGVEVIDMGVVADEPTAMEEAFRMAAANADAVITSGGVSVGEADYIKPVLEKLGKIDFWKIAIKPGRPLTFGKLGDALFFGLPGNPVAVMVTFQLFVKPTLLKLAGEQDYTPTLIEAVCMEKIRKKPGRAEFIRGVLSRNVDGLLTVKKAGHQGSGILTSMSQADCFIMLPENCDGVAQGDTVSVQLFERFWR